MGERAGARRRVVGGVLAVLLVVSGCTAQRGGSVDRPAGPAGSPGVARDFRPGEAGVGDPYFPRYGNGGYDVGNYDLEIRYDPATDRLTGHATITAMATADLSRFNLDLAGLVVESIAVNGKAARHAREDTELIVTPAAGLARDETFTVDIRYSGVPQSVSQPGLGSRGWLHTADGALALGEPESASGWFPVNDHPLDKATYTIAISVPEGLAALSVGVPEGRTSAGGWTTWTWAERSPMASYLASVVIGRYRVTTGSHNGKPVVTAVAEALAEGAADRAMARTGEIADFLASRFGPYPFDAYGGIVHNESRVGFALENQARPVYSASFFRTGDGTSVVAHELAHQWFGDSVSVYHWSDIWLNEGFATYAEWLWSEHTGRATAQGIFTQRYDGADAAFWQTPPGDPGRTNIFSRAVYLRGGMTVHALRRTVGDTAFFRILRTWTAEKRYGNGTTAEFISLAERVSGTPLRALFDGWLLRPAKPARP